MKLICWNDYAIPVDDEYNWMAMDKNGQWYAYKEKPIIQYDVWAVKFANYLNDTSVISEAKIEPPEPGNWKTQLYWIGD